MSTSTAPGLRSGGGGGGKSSRRRSCCSSPEVAVTAAQALMNSLSSLISLILCSLRNLSCSSAIDEIEESSFSIKLNIGRE